MGVRLVPKCVGGALLRRDRGASVYDPEIAAHTSSVIHETLSALAQSNCSAARSNDFRLGADPVRAKLTTRNTSIVAPSASCSSLLRG
jgi:hypothetical protein